MIWSQYITTCQTLTYVIQVYHLFVLPVESLALADTVLHHAVNVSVSCIGYGLGKVVLC